MTFAFFMESALLGAGLAMDAFSVSLANGLREPEMGRGRIRSPALRAGPDPPGRGHLHRRPLGGLHHRAV